MKLILFLLCFVSMAHASYFPSLVTTQGVIKPESFSFSFGTTNATTACSASPCSYLDQIGAGVTQVTRSGAGQYSITFSKTFSKVKCTGNGVGAALVNYYPIACASCSSISFTSQQPPAGAATDSYGTIVCHGYAP